MQFCTDKLQVHPSYGRKAILGHVQHVHTNSPMPSTICELLDAPGVNWAPWCYSQKV